MSIEATPLGNACNIKCTYCYQHGMRDAGNETATGGAYDLEAMFRAIEAEGVGQPDGRGGRTGFTLFGGEPLLLPIADVERVFAYAAAKGVPVGIQTNGTLITEAHLALFSRYRVGVGISMDGPEDLNDTRWNGNLASTRALTARSQWALEQCLARGISASLIVTLTTRNATGDRLPRLVAWVRDLHARGLRWLNLHALEVDHALVGEQLALTTADHVAALTAFGALALPGLHVAPLDAYRKLLLGQDRTSDHVNCIWHACDPYTTSAVRGVDGRGTRGNCGRTNKDGVVWLKGETAGYERQLALYFTPFEHGGCAGCRFFFACKGECPGTAERGDWRNRTGHCATVLAMFTAAEAQLRTEGREPLSQSVQRPLIEARLLAAWANGRNLSVAGALSVPAETTDRPHGDIPHGDAPHGDHTDQQTPVITG